MQHQLGHSLVLHGNIQPSLDIAVVLLLNYSISMTIQQESRVNCQSITAKVRDE